LLDFETIRVALYHLIDNTSKYILPDTQLRIKFSAGEHKFIVSFEMISMEIKEHELEDIFNEGISGENAKKVKKNGDGLGLPIIKTILKLHHTNLKIFPNLQPSFNSKYDGVNYVRNLFEITFET
jgi:K+-sensing histidine kinase KdpD